MGLAAATAGRRRQCPLASGPGLAPRMLGLRLNWAKGRFWSKIDKKRNILRMEFFLVENLCGPHRVRRAFLAYLEAPHSVLVKKTKTKHKMIELY